MKRVPKGINRGDLVVVHWRDITGSPTVPPEQARTAYCSTPGWYYGTKVSEGHECVVVACTVHTGWEDEPYSGHDIYPISIVDEIEKILT